MPTPFNIFNNLPNLEVANDVQQFFGRICGRKIGEGRQMGERCFWGSFHISKICQRLTFSPCPCLNHLSTMSHANQFQHLQQCDMKRHEPFLRHNRFIHVFFPHMDVFFCHMSHVNQFHKIVIMFMFQTFVHNDACQPIPTCQQFSELGGCQRFATIFRMRLWLDDWWESTNGNLKHERDTN